MNRNNGLLCALLIIGGAVLARAQEAQEPPPGQIPQATNENNLRPAMTVGDTVIFGGDASLAGGQLAISFPDFAATVLKKKADGGSLRVQITCRNTWSKLWVSDVTDTGFTVSTDATGNKDQAFYWDVRALTNWEK